LRSLVRVAESARVAARCQERNDSSSAGSLELWRIVYSQALLRCLAQQSIQIGNRFDMIDALEYALGIYGVSFIVTMLVWLVILAIRWLSGDRRHAKTTAAKV
jgi:hypothetical protein